MKEKKVVVLTGAGMSAESGLRTFRDANGLWEGHDVMQVASQEGFAKDPQLVLEFYNQRRRQLLQVVPNKGHEALVRLEDHCQVTIVTQNVDDLHERAGSTRVVHLHGELLKVRSTMDETNVLEWRDDLVLGDVDENGHQLRPHIVWFGEMVPLMETAADLVAKAAIVLVIGTSMQVYPAAGLLTYAGPGIPIYFVDPKPMIERTQYPNLEVIAEKATIGVPLVVDRIIAGHDPK